MEDVGMESLATIPSKSLRCFGLKRSPNKECVKHEISKKKDFNLNIFFSFYNQKRSARIPVTIVNRKKYKKRMQP